MKSICFPNIGIVVGTTITLFFNQYGSFVHTFSLTTKTCTTTLQQRQQHQHHQQLMHINAFVPIHSIQNKLRQDQQQLLLRAIISERKSSSSYTTTSSLNAGGFEWEDPESTLFDQGVDNPYKNPNLLLNKDDGTDSTNMKVDAARLLSPRLNGSNLYFVGMMGSGKSAIAKIIAKRMGSYTFLDTDEIIEKAVGMSISEIFKTEGETAFRDVESQVLNTVYAYIRCVISTGGGIVCRRDNWSKLQNGIVVWLDVSPEIIINRITGNTDRPLLQTKDPLQTLRELQKEREVMYMNADVRIQVLDSNETEEDVADRVVRDIHDYIDDNPPAWKQAKMKAQAEGLDWVR